MGDLGLPQRMVLSAISGMGAATCCHPLDVLRVQLQIDTEGGKSRQYKGMVDCARQLVRNKGVVNGLYPGNPRKNVTKLQYTKKISTKGSNFQNGSDVQKRLRVKSESPATKFIVVHILKSSMFWCFLIKIHGRYPLRNLHFKKIFFDKNPYGMAFTKSSFFDAFDIKS